MAKKRLNTKFIIILAIVLAIPLGGWFVWKVLAAYFPRVGYIWRGTPQSHAEQAKALFDQGKYEEAGERFKRAIQVRGSPNAELLTNIGDCYSHMVLSEKTKGNENLRFARLFWEQAVSVDPNYTEANRRLLDFFQQNAESIRGINSAQWWQEVHSLASKIVAQDPNDRATQLTMHRAVLMRWVNGADTDEQKIKGAIDALTKMSLQPPFDAEVFFTLVQARMFEAERRRMASDRTGALAINEEVKQQLADMLQAHPESALLHYRAATVYRLFSAIERSANQAPKYMTEFASELEKAATLVKRDEPQYLEIKVTWARELERLGKSAEAEGVYRQVIADQPDELQVRIILAELIGRNTSRRDDALKLVENYPPGDPKVQYGVKALRYQQIELTALATATSLKLDGLPESTSVEQYQTTLKQVEDAYAKLLAEAGEGGPTLLIRGRIEMAKGQNIQAVQTLDRCAMIPLPTPAGPYDVEQYYKTLFLLARANLLVEQTARAKELLAKIVKDIPKFDPARIQLVQLLLREKNYADAREHLEALNKSMPGSQVVTRLNMMSLDKEKDKTKLIELYTTLPETTPQEMAEKAQMAQYCERPDEAARLLEAVRAVRPDDVELLGSLAQLYLDLGDRSRAAPIVEHALSKQPENARLKILQAQVRGDSIASIRQEVVDQIKDPFDKEMARFELAMQENREDDALAHVKAAHLLKPDNGRTLSVLFQFALARKEWDQASQYLETLARMNFDNANGRLYRVKYALARGNLDEAASKAQELAQNMPEFAHSWVVLGQVQMAQGQTTTGKYAEALANFMTALNKQAQNLDAIRGIISCSYALGQTTTAKRYIDEGRKLFPMNVVLREIEIEHILQYDPEPEKAIAPRQEALDKAIASQSPGEAMARLKLAQTYMIVARGKSTAEAKPYLEKARDTYKGAMQKFPDELRFVQLYANVCMRLGAAGEGEKAIQALLAREAWKGKPDVTLMLAQYYERTGKFAEQEKVLRDYLAGAPNNAMALRDLALLLSKRNKLDEALKLLEPTADEPPIRKLRIELQINGGRLEDAMKEINTALASTPNPPSMLRIRQAFVFMNSGRAKEALAVLDQVLAVEPGNADALLMRATIYVAASRNLDQAIRDLQMVRDGLDDLESRMTLAEAFVRKGDDDSAIRELENTIRAKPDEKEPKLKLAQLCGRVQPPRWSQAERVLKDARSAPGMSNDVELIHAEAVMWVQRKNFDLARQSIEQAIKLAPTNLKLLETYCDVLIGLRQYAGLLKVTDPFLKDKTAPPWVYQFRGRAKKALDDREGAMAEWQAGIDLASTAKDDPAIERIINTIASEMGAKSAISRILARAEKDPRWRLMAAYLYQIDGDILSAVSWVEKALNDEASLPPEAWNTARRMAGSFYLALDPPNIEKAVVNYRKMLDRDPNDIAALNNLACTMILPNSGFTPKDALVQSQKAYDLIQQSGGKNPFVNDTHGYVLVINGKSDEGIALLLEALDQEPIPDAYYHLGEAYLARATPSVADAEQALKQAQQLIERASAENKPLDATLKSKVDKALERCRQAAPATAPAASS